MNKEEYHKRLEKTTEKIKTDRCSEDEIENIERQKLYLAEHYISSLEQENKKYKEVIDKAIEYIENNSLYEEEYDYDYEENSYLSGIDDETAKKDLLKILRGGIK